MEQEAVYSNISENDTFDMDGLDCPVCLESYDEGQHTPKMMPCLHTLCSSCIANLTSDTTQKKQTPASQEATTTTTTTTAARNNRVSTLVTALELGSGHPALRRISGYGAVSPTSRQPNDPLPPTPPTPSTSPPTTPTAYTAVRRPEVSPPLPPKPEGQLQRVETVQCPLCRSEVNTNKLQTNRYVLAHMRDLKRLSLVTQSSESTFMPQNIWCVECKVPATKTCAYHQLIPIAKWIETQKATVESLQMAVEDQLDQHTAHLHNLESIIKGIFHSLNKASKYIWDTKKQVEEMKADLKTCSIPENASPMQKAQMLGREVERLEGEAAKASQKELTEGNSEVLVSLNEDVKKRLILLTYNPDLSLSITLTHGHTSMV